MKSLIILVFAVAIYSVEGLYSQKCKEAETSSDKLVRFIENANCTLLEGRQRLRQGFKNIQQKFQTGIKTMKGLWAMNTTKTVQKNENDQDKLDFEIDVRSFNGDEVRQISKRDTNDEEGGGDGKEVQNFCFVNWFTLTRQSAHIFKNITKRIYLKNISENEPKTDDETAENEAKPDDDTEETTIAINVHHIFLAPNKCRSNQRFINGRCRSIL